VMVLGCGKRQAYVRVMDDDDETPRPPPPEWIEALERGRADVAAGRVSSWDEVRARLVAHIAAANAASYRRKA
jgi:hypothetical protein